MPFVSISRPAIAVEDLPSGDGVGLTVAERLQITFPLGVNYAIASVGAVGQGSATAYTVNSSALDVGAVGQGSATAYAVNSATLEVNP